MDLLQKRDVAPDVVAFHIFTKTEVGAVERSAVPTPQHASGLRTAQAAAPSRSRPTE